jgi:hypothetical protein
MEQVMKAGTILQPESRQAIATAMAQERTLEAVLQTIVNPLGDCPSIALARIWLAEHFITLACRRLKFPRPELSDAQVEPLQSYRWPGNIRELQNVIERALIISQGGLLRLEPLLDEDSAASLTARMNGARANAKLVSEAERIERERANIVAALEQADWKIYGPGAAAAALGINGSTLSSACSKPMRARTSYSTTRSGTAQTPSRFRPTRWRNCRRSRLNIRAASTRRTPESFLLAKETTLSKRWVSRTSSSACTRPSRKRSPPGRWTKRRRQSTKSAALRWRI